MILSRNLLKIIFLFTILVVSVLISLNQPKDVFAGCCGCGTKTEPVPPYSCDLPASNCTSCAYCPPGAGSCPAICRPDCSGKSCGGDGCGGSCGSCPGGTSCSNGSCVVGVGATAAPGATPTPGGGSSTCSACGGSGCCACNSGCCGLCGGPGLQYEYVWPFKSSGVVGTNQSSCSNYIGSFGISFSAHITGGPAGLCTVGAAVNPGCISSPCAGWTCSFDKSLGCAYSLTMTVNPPSGYSLGAINWWDDQGETGSSPTFTATVGDGTNVSFTPYFNFICINTKSTLYASNQSSTGWSAANISDNNPPIYLYTDVTNNAGNPLSYTDTQNKISDTNKSTNSTIASKLFNDQVVTYDYSLAAGNYTLQTKYSGNSYWCASSDTLVLTVLAPPTPTPTSTPTPTQTPTATPTPGPWRQVLGGDSYQPAISPPLLPAGKYYLDNSPGMAQSAGVLYAQGSPNITVVPTGFDSPTHWQGIAPNNFGNPYNFDYYKSTLLRNPVDDQPSATNITNLSGPPSVHYFHGSSTYTIPSPLTINPAGTNVSIFLIEGDLNINGDVTVASNVTASFIVKGNITVSNAVGTLEGVYITNGSSPGDFNVSAGSNRLIINGMVYATTVTEGRTYVNANNATYKYSYQPSFLLPLLPLLGRTQVTWQEVAP